MSEPFVDLGFAHLRLSDERTLDVIDVPGHRRFVPNMLAGCGAVDLTLFVVSAREGDRVATVEGKGDFGAPCTLGELEPVYRALDLEALGDWMNE